MPGSFPSIAGRALLLCLLPFLIGGGKTVSPETGSSGDERGPSPSLASPADEDQAPTYISHYLVFGTRDAKGRPRIVAIDFNRTTGPDSIAYEYKLFLATDSSWSMPVYERWKTSTSDAPNSLSPRGGLLPTLREGTVRKVATDLANIDLEVTVESPSFSLPTEEPKSAVRTAHPQLTVRWNETTFRGPGVYEYIRSAGSSPSKEAVAERQRRLDPESTFGLYDWIVLYDETGRLWQVSQGTLTEDFAYQPHSRPLPRETDDVLVRWPSTAYDSTARQHSPTEWLVDVPAWQMRVKLQELGEHRGHGPPRSDGTRPIYVQASVEGTGTIQGEEHRFFGMVEQIRD